jgi:hypothetical protein
MADITVQKSLVVDKAGGLAKERVNRLVRELAQLIKRVIKIEIEILQGEKGQLEAELQEEQQRAAASAKAVDVSRIVVDDEHEYWPFRGEYWRDELGYYRVKLINKCERAGAPEGAPAGPTQ